MAGSKAIAVQKPWTAIFLHLTAIADGYTYVESKTGEHKIFNQEIDLLYPETSKKFYDYIEDLIQNAMAFINALISIIDDKI